MEIYDLFNRIQNGKALKTGELINAMTDIEFVTDLKKNVLPKIEKNFMILKLPFSRCEHLKLLLMAYSTLDQNFEKCSKRKLLSFALKDCNNFPYDKDIFITLILALFPYICDFKKKNHIRSRGKYLEYGDILVLINFLFPLWQNIIPENEEDLLEKTMCVYNKERKSKCKQWSEFKSGINMCKNRLEVLKKKFHYNPRVPQSLKKLLWNKHFGSENGHGACYVCSDKICSLNFEAGHVRAAIEGGSTKIDNLKPICACCNKSMGVGNMEVYKQRYFTK